jgi:hypothetical protein
MMTRKQEMAKLSKALKHLEAAKALLEVSEPSLVKDLAALLYTVKRCVETEVEYTGEA